MTILKARQTRCSLCSLGCVLGFESTPMGKVLPEYPGSITEIRHGICGRGHLNYEMLDHPLRLEQPMVRKGDGFEPVALTTIIGNLAVKLAADPTLVLVDGSLPAEDIVAAAGLAKLLPKESVFSIYMDPADQGMLIGVAASGAAILTPEELAECDAVLSIGDAFGTHPIISRAVHAITKRNPRRMLAVIDSVPTRTSRFATSFIQVRPGSTSTLLGFLAGKAVTAAQATQACQVSESEIAALDTRLKGAKKLAVLLSCDFARDSDPRSIAFAAGAIAVNGSGGILPLPLLGNAWGALGIAYALKATPTGEALANLLAGKFKNALLIGIDPSLETPLKGLRKALDVTPTVIVASRLRPTPQTCGTHFLPLATVVETPGTVVNGSGEVMELPAVAAPAGGSMTTRDIVLAFAPRLSAGSAITTTLKSEWLKPMSLSVKVCEGEQTLLVEPADGELVAVSESGCVHVGSGAASPRMSWPNVFEQSPVVRVSPTDAASAGLKEAQTVTVTSPNGTATMTVKLDVAMKPGRVALMAATPDVRALFNWATAADGRIVCGPTAIRVNPS